MTYERPWMMQADSGDPEIEYSALDVRRVTAMLITTEGVGGPTHLEVTQRAAGANFSVDIAVGFVAITGDDTTNQGMYVCQNTAVKNVVIPSPPVSGSRIHRVIARVTDPLHEGSWTDYEWYAECLEDTGSGTPAQPDSAITLALVTVASGASNVTNANINNQRSTAAVLSQSSNLRMLRYADSTPVVSSTTLADDSDLTVTLPGGIHYKLAGQLIYSTRSDTDFKFRLVTPTNATFDGKFSGLLPGDTGISGVVPHDREVQNTDYIFGGEGANNTTYMIVEMSGWLYSGDGGTFKIQWAQNVSNATGTILRGKSFVDLERIA